MMSLAILAVLVVAANDEISAQAIPSPNNDCTTTEISYHPYHISIRSHVHSVTYEHVCGGAIISENFIVTTAHCLKENPKGMYINVGTSIKGLGTAHDIDNFARHEDFRLKDGITEHDIAVVKVKEPISLTRKIELFRGRVKAGSKAVFTSFRVARQLQNRTLEIMSKDDCSDQYQGRLKEGQICAGFRNSTTCLGEDGSPLIIDGKLAGITGFASGSSNPDLVPIVYADISYYRDWILNKTNTL